MGRPEEIAKHHAGDEDNCDVSIRNVKTGASALAAAFIPVFAGAAIVASFGPGVLVQAGDEVRRLSDGKLFKVAQVLKKGREGRTHAALEKIHAS